MGNLGFWEIFLIVGAFVLLFGSKKIPDLAQGIGKGMREFKKALRDVEEDIKVEGKTEKKETEQKS